MKDLRDRGTVTVSGFILLAVVIAALLYGIQLLPPFIAAIDNESLSPSQIGGAALAVVLFFIVVPSFVVLAPNEAVVLLFFGSYIGTLKRAGFWWVIPFTSKQRISLRAVSLNTSTLKVNDSRGNPIEIAAVIVWHVADAAKAALNVDAYGPFVMVQSETAVRSLASRYPYDSEEHEESLRGSPDKLSLELAEELKKRLAVAGIEIIETRLSHLAYAPEIASAMLRRQQADAVVRARRIITENAVSMVENALSQLESRGVIKMDDSSKTRLVSNLLVALVSEHDTQPVLDLNP
ncbi:MAG: SPFH domain-containing protein [Alphaproteobacteria bacterium]|nr:SPFH domain-containing protein [Alphaproteobacteria bacterium]